MTAQKQTGQKPYGQGFREGTSPIDREELARLLPAGLDGFGPSTLREGNSPPMDQDAWMAHMMGNLWSATAAQQQQQHFQPHHAYFDDGERGRGRGRRGRGGRGRSEAFHPLAAYPYVPAQAPQGQGVPSGPPQRSGYAVVEFKRQRLKKYQCPASIPTGEYVIVDGDRGQDCGLVVQVIAVGTDGKVEITSLDGTDVDGTKLKVEPGRVLRVASEMEVSLLHNEITALERAALSTCRARCKEAGFNFEVIDCEYQFDRKKISFFFDSDHSVDFRDLVKDLYKLFGTRIWMENVNPGVKNVVPQGALSRHEKAALARAATSRTGEVTVSARPSYPRARQSGQTAAGQEPAQ